MKWLLGFEQRSGGALAIPSPVDLREAVDFAVCSTFYLVLGWSGDFWDP